MSFSRRHFIASTSGAAAGIALPFHAFAQGAPIKLGSVLDNSGNLDAYGKPMVLATTLAAEEINAAGGLLGRKIQVVQYDTQSDIALYTKYAQQLARDDKVDVVHGGITSASREAIRQTFRRANILYFYNVLYEGGVCDRNCFVTGTTPAQAVEPIVEISQKQWGKKVYVLAADYNYGQITAKWVAHYVKQRGGSVLQTDFFPLDVADFGSTIAKIQAAKPDSVCAALVGGAHLSFFRQWAASGMNKKIPLYSTTFGVGNEHLALSPAEGDGILIAGNYSQEETDAGEQGLPRALGQALRRHQDRPRDRGLAVPGHQALGRGGEEGRLARPRQADEGARVRHQRRGTGRPRQDGPATHHASLDIKVMEVKGQKLTIKQAFKQRPPSDTAASCNLAKNPNENKQFEVTI
jgi:branched-chain amino acid transport system substrate-binding protein